MTREREGGAQHSELTRFGRWIAVLCDLLGTNPTALAERAGVPSSTAWGFIRTQERLGALHVIRPEIENVEKLWSALASLASELGMPFSEEDREKFWNAADHVSDHQHDQEEKRLSELRTLASLLKEKDRQIAQLRREINVLRKQHGRRSK